MLNPLDFSFKVGGLKMRVSSDDPDWTAPEDGHDWCDDTVLLAIAWFSELTDRNNLLLRLEKTHEKFLAAKKDWLSGSLSPLFDSRDTTAWYLFQANAYANDRMNWIPQEAARIVPIFTRIGLELPELLKISGVEERAARIMNNERSQPDGGFFELLIALAYRRAGWDVAFVPERRGISKTHDLNVSRGGSRWAVECKRLDRSSYEVRERARGEGLAATVHPLALQAGRSIDVQVVFDAELESVPQEYLAIHVSRYLENQRNNIWIDKLGAGSITEIDWGMAHRVLKKDFVYFGSSRMIELLTGTYDHDFAYSMAGKWRPARERALWADAVYQASVVSWRNSSGQATIRKAGHFRRTVAAASRQLPSDRPGVVHVGVESWGGTQVDGIRHFLNLMEMAKFDPKGSRLRWVYGEYFAPEVSTRRDESWAVEETSATYRVGRHRTPEPLPHHLIFGGEQNVKLGEHWDPEGQRPYRP